ncbi:MAG TPA: hypothetical protein VKX49_10085 [Bryobacteraceae bacterium]|nr:hypothetical protein [Bryobacteraceae bacterium]
MVRIEPARIIALQSALSWVWSMRYRLNEPIVAARKRFSETESARIALPVGAVLRVPADTPQRGLIEAEWDGQLVRVFAEDVRSRGCLVEIVDSD